MLSAEMCCIPIQTEWWGAGGGQSQKGANCGPWRVCVPSVSPNLLLYFQHSLDEGESLGIEFDLELFQTDA